MSRTKQFGNDPIILVTLPTDLTPDVVRENQKEIKSLMESLGGDAIIMVDLRDVDLSFSDYMTLVNRVSSNGAHHYPTILIGSNRFLKSYQRTAENTSIKNLQVYHDFSNAIRASRRLLKQTAY